MGIDLSMQNPDRNAEHWEDASEVGGGSEKQVYSWLSTAPVDEEVKSNSKYVGLGNFEKVLSDAKFYKALKIQLYMFLDLFYSSCHSRLDYRSVFFNSPGLPVGCWFFA